jgi:F-type H+-transporting ATPase subunit delta
VKAGAVSQEIIEPYAEALMSVAKEQDLVERFDNDVQYILASLSASDDLKRLLSIPLIKNDLKKGAIANVYAQVHPFLLNFMQLLVDRRRIMYLEQIANQFQALLREMNQVARAEVISAIELGEAQQETLKQKVTEMTKSRSVELSIKVDPDLIGGVIIKVGSQVIDASIRGQLRRITSSLTAKV